MEYLINDPDFKYFIARNTFIHLFFVLIILFLFSFYLMSWTWFPDIVNYRFPKDSQISLEIWMTFVLVISSIILSAFYTFVIGSKSEKLKNALLQKRVYKHVNKNV